MYITRDIADHFFSLRIFFGYNCTQPTDRSYGWLDLPFEVNPSETITIEERVGFHGGKYFPSIGAPNVAPISTVGSFSYSYSSLPLGLKIGRYCSISSGLNFLDSHHPTTTLTTSAFTFRPNNPLWKDYFDNKNATINSKWHIYNEKTFPSIGNDVWIGKNVTLAMGITIGTGSVIAANSVVTKDIPPYTIVGGNPASVLRSRFSIDNANYLLGSKWWDLDPFFISRIFSTDIKRAIFEIERNTGNIPRYNPDIVMISNNSIEFKKLF